MNWNHDEADGKIKQSHRKRKAFVYIRQSSMKQVENNLESQDLQYKLVKRAAALGWEDQQISVIDDDLGKSGASMLDRDGFKTLIAEVALDHVGIILVTDVSRLARNCADWYQLLNVARVFCTLISDSMGIYDPSGFDDRMLLGMKGTIAEAQLQVMHTQLNAAKFNKASRGELRLPLPVGYEHLPTGEVVKAPDAEVRSAIDMVFTQFDRLGSAHQVLRYLHANNLLLPHMHGAGAMREIVWEKPSAHGVMSILKQATYTGTYIYGKQRSIPVRGSATKMSRETVAQEDWSVVIQNAFPGYLTWEKYMDNQRRLHENVQKGPAPGAPRHGQALLAGLVTCARCGHPIHVHYTHSPAYVCDRASRDYGEPRCARFSIGHIDAAVADAFLQILQPAHLAVAVAAADDIAAQRKALAEHWRLRIDRARYDADLARRRYEKVDPDLRLVAQSLKSMGRQTRPLAKS